MIINNEFYLKMSEDLFASMARAATEFYTETNELYDRGYMTDNNPIVQAMDDMVRYIDAMIDSSGRQPWFTRWIWGAEYGAPLGSGCTIRYIEDKKPEIYFNDIHKYYDFMMRNLDNEDISDDI